MVNQATERYCPLVKRECVGGCAWRGTGGGCMIPQSLDSIAASLDIISDELVRPRWERDHAQSGEPAATTAKTE